MSWPGVSETYHVYNAKYKLYKYFNMVSRFLKCFLVLKYLLEILLLTTTRNNVKANFKIISLYILCYISWEVKIILIKIVLLLFPIVIYIFVHVGLNKLINLIQYRIHIPDWCSAVNENAYTRSKISWYFSVSSMFI